MPQTAETEAPTTGPQAVALVIKGGCMGVADAIPGVSGGTVALILGVYRRLIEAIRSFTPGTVLALLRTAPGLWQAGRRPHLIRAARELHLDFLIPLGCGIAPAIVIGTKIIPSLIDVHRGPMFALFFGMILVSTWVPYAMLRRRGAGELVLAVLGAAAAYWIVGLSVNTEPTLPFIFVCGAIAICAMILPGVSGSYLLQALGQYRHISAALHSLDLATIGVFLIGVVVGITTFVRILSWLLRHYESATLAVLTGLMLGSLRSVWPFQRPTGEILEIKGHAVPVMVNVWPGQWGSQELVILLCLALGIGLVIGMIVIDRRLQPAADHSA